MAPAAMAFEIDEMSDSERAIFRSEIRDYLLENGVSSSNILYTIGYGEDKILNQCTNGVYCLDFLHKKNERQLIVILNYNILF